MIECAMRIRRDDAMGETKIHPHARADAQPPRVFGSEIVVQELDAGFDSIQGLVQNHRVAWRQSEKERVAIQAAPEFPSKRCHFRDALLVYFDAIQHTIAF